MLPVWRIVIPTPFKVGPVNVYLIREDPVTLVDAGPYTPEAQAALRQGLAEAGLSLKDVRRVILTHGHPDHYGLAVAIRDISGAAVFLHPRELEKTAQEVNFIQERGDLLRWAGIPEEILHLVERVYISDRAYALPLKDITPITDGLVFPFEKHRLKAFRLPGHSTGQCNFYEPEERLFFAGDNLLAHITPNPLLEPGDEPEGPKIISGTGPARQPTLSLYLETLGFIEGLEINLVYPGHGPAIQDHRARIAEIRRHHLARQLEILGALNGRPRTVLELSQHFFPDLQGFDLFLGLSEVQAHLDLLVQEGRAGVLEKLGIGYYFVN